MNYSVAARLRAAVALNPDHFPVSLPLNGTCFTSTEQTAFPGKLWALEKGLAQKFEDVLGPCRVDRDHLGCTWRGPLEACLVAVPWFLCPDDV